MLLFTENTCKPEKILKRVRSSLLLREKELLPPSDEAEEECALLDIMSELMVLI